MAEEELWQAELNREALEREIAREIPEFAVRQLASRPPTARRWPTPFRRRSVAIEFLRYSAFDFTAIRSRGDDAWQPPRYLAIVIGPGKPASPRSLT